MRISLISTGEELLNGDIVDTNAAWLAERLRESGFKLNWHLTVGDDLASLTDAFELASQRSDLCFVNGGLGPTTDDLSAQAAAQWKGESLTERAEWVARLKEYHAKNNRVMPQSNLKQAQLPASASIVDNPVGTACGFKLNHNGCDLYFTPGVPFEFKQMVSEQILPQLLAEQAQQEPQLKRWLTYGLSESILADQLDPIVLPQGATLGYRSAMPTIEVKLSVPAKAEQNDIDQVCEAITQQLGDFVFVHEKSTLAQQIQKLLIASNETLATAESCTGGLIAEWLVTESGSSSYFERGYVTYSNEAKQDSLGLNAELIEQHGAVSLPVVMAMAEGAKREANTHYGLATSGIAGPTGGSEAKPVGTIGFALATPEGTYGQLLVLPNRGRTFLRRYSAALALDMLRRYQEKRSVFGQYTTVKVVAQKAP